MSSRLIGGILLVVGTSIGGGMLALPVATAQEGFLGALFLLFGSWAVMTLGALLLLEVNLWFPQDSNIVSMARATLGRPGELIAWFSYLMLLYSLLAAYTSGGADVLHHLLTKNKIALSPQISALIFSLVLGIILYLGIQSTDYVNRALMSFKLITFIVLTVLIIPHIHYSWLVRFDPKCMISSLTLIIASFGFASLVPSLRSYFNSDLRKTRKAIIMGSFIPLICYIVWIAVILGDLPLTGKNSLLSMIASGHTTSSLVHSIQTEVHNGWIGAAAFWFTSICVVTSYLGVALSLSDFLSDGMGLKKIGLQKIGVYSATFIPPLFIVLVYPSAFLFCLRYAGILCVILLVILPGLMAWQGRYSLKLATGYRVFGEKIILSLVVFVGLFVILKEIFF